MESIIEEFENGPFGFQLNKIKLFLKYGLTDAGRHTAMGSHNISNFEANFDKSDIIIMHLETGEFKKPKYYELFFCNYMVICKNLRINKNNLFLEENDTSSLSQFDLNLMIYINLYREYSRRLC